jgi:amino acid transporter
MVATEARGELARNAIGLREVLFQSITHMAPGAAVAFSIIVGANFAAGALPLSILFALVGCLFVAVSIGQLAKHLPSAAGFATYASRGVHPSVGFLVAWGYALAEALVAPLLYLIFANVVAGTLAAEYGWSFDTWWPIAAVVAAVLVLVFGWFGIRLSAGAGTILGLFEIVVFSALAIWMIIKAGGNNTLSVFGTSHATVEGFSGFNGIVAGSVFAILAFIGFEAAAPLAEETRNPGRTVRVAVVASAVLIGAFYVLTTYAATVFFGPDKFAEFPAYGDGNPWQQVARDVWGGGWILVFVAILISAIANSNAGANATTRTWYALGRNRILVGMLAKTHPLESDRYIMSTGSARPLEDAFRISQVDLVGWLCGQYGFETLDAYQLITQAAEAPVANVCDPNYTFVSKIRKEYLPRVDAYLGAHQRLAELASAYRAART